MQNYGDTETHDDEHILRMKPEPYAQTLLASSKIVKWKGVKNYGTTKTEAE